MKKWYKSRTVWGSVGLVMIIVGSYWRGDMDLKTAIITGLIGIGSVINRYYTDQSIRKINGG